MTERSASSTTVPSSSAFGRYERAMAWRYLRARKEQGGISTSALISVIGIGLAVTALIVVLSVMSGVQAQLIQSVIGGQGHIRIQTGATPEVQVLEAADTISNISGIESASPIVEGGVLLEGPEGAIFGFVRAIRTEDIPIYDALSDLEGTTEFGDGRKGGNTIFIATGVADQLLGRAAPGPISEEDLPRVVMQTQKKTQLAFGTKEGQSKTYRVGGVFQTGYLFLDTQMIVMPIEQAQLMIGERDQFTAIDVRLTDFKNTEPAMMAIRDALGPGIRMEDWKSNGANRQALARISDSRNLLRIILLVLIVITALNIITGVVMLVKNKARDIAILRTIGLGRASVMRIFLMVGTTLGLIGTIIGVALGVTMVLNLSAIVGAINTLIDGQVFPASVYGFETLPAEINLDDMAFTVFWALGMSILVTLPPAWIAARTDPVDALRYE